MNTLLCKFEYYHTRYYHTRYCHTRYYYTRYCHTRYYHTMSNQKIILVIILQKKIPMALIKYIYEEFFEANIVYQQFINALECEKSQRLNIESLFNNIKIIFHKNKKNSMIIPYICKNNEIFNEYYIAHYINNIKHFKHLYIDKSFALCILMTLYH